MVLVHVRFLRHPIPVQFRWSVGSINNFSSSSIDLNSSGKLPKLTPEGRRKDRNDLVKEKQQDKTYDLRPKSSMKQLLNEYYQKEDTVLKPNWWTNQYKGKNSSVKKELTNKFQRSTQSTEREELKAQLRERNQTNDVKGETKIQPSKAMKSVTIKPLTSSMLSKRPNTTLNALLKEHNQGYSPQKTPQNSDQMGNYKPVQRQMKRIGKSFDKDTQGLEILHGGRENSFADQRDELRPVSKPSFGRQGAKYLPQNYKATSTDNRVEDRDLARRAKNTMSPERFKYASKLLDVFTEHSENVPNKQQGDQKYADIPLMATWHELSKLELQRKLYDVPKNAFEELIGWTKEGKIWKFPIDNEQGMEEEQNVHFSQHIFLDQHLEDWCPTEGPIRHYMELVCIGLSKNPYLTVQEKITHITWYKNYFTQRAKLMEELEIWNTRPAEERDEACQEQ